MSPDRVFISFTPTPLHLSNNPSFSLSTWLIHITPSLYQHCLPFSPTLVCLPVLPVIADCLSFADPSIYLYSLLFYPLLEVNGWFQSVRAEWLITVEDRGGCSSYQHHLYSVNSAAPQCASFFSLQSCAFFWLFETRLSSTCLTFSHPLHPMLSFYSTEQTLTPENHQCREAGIYNTNSWNIVIHLHSCFKYLGFHCMHF